GHGRFRRRPEARRGRTDSCGPGRGVQLAGTRGRCRLARLRRPPGEADRRRGVSGPGPRLLPRLSAITVLAPLLDWVLARSTRSHSQATIVTRQTPTTKGGKHDQHAATTKEPQREGDPRTAPGH